MAEFRAIAKLRRECLRTTFIESVAGALAALLVVLGVSAQEGGRFAFVQVSSQQQRLRYLATAEIWSDPGELTPEMVLSGRPLQEAGALNAALRGQPLECRFTRPGKLLGGNTPKFACQTAEGRALRIKYSDGSGDGNREVFAAVAGTRHTGADAWVAAFKDKVAQIAGQRCAE